MLSLGEAIKGMGYLTFWWLSHLRLSYANCLGNFQVMLLSFFYLFVLNSVFLKINQAFVSQTLLLWNYLHLSWGKLCLKSLFLAQILTSLSLSLSLTFCMFPFPTPVFCFSLIFFFLLFGLLVCQPLLPCSLPSLQNKMVKGSLSTEQSERGWGGKCTPGNGYKSKHRWVGESFQFHLLSYIQCLPHFCEKSRCFCIYSENL